MFHGGMSDKWNSLADLIIANEKFIQYRPSSSVRGNGTISLNEINPGSRINSFNVEKVDPHERQARYETRFIGF